ncbi:MAG: TIGR02281 family clan AA aspartic protease [Pseudomonadota bacterium]
MTPHRILVVLLLSLVLVLPGRALANDDISIQTIALFKDRAMLSINGKRAKIIRVGDTLDGVKLIESSTKRAIVEVSGKREELTLNSGVVLSGELKTQAPIGAQTSAQLWADSNGFFRANGTVNGRSLEFLVDTGANLVVLSSQQADSLDLEYLNGVQGYASTASGTAPMYMIEADEISIAGISLNNIRMGVILGNYPRVPLLGMTFLERLDMNRSGNQMILKKRF